MSGVTVGNGFRCGKGVYLSCTDNGVVKIGDNVYIGRNAKLISQGGEIEIGDNSYLGDGVVVVSKSGVSIGADALIAEYVVIRDQDHVYSNGTIRSAGFSKAPIVIENNVWLAAKSTVLKGVVIGSGAVVAAHAVVNKDVPSGVVVAGVPIRQV